MDVLKLLMTLKKISNIVLLGIGFKAETLYFI